MATEQKAGPRTDQLTDPDYLERLGKLGKDNRERVFAILEREAKHIRLLSWACLACAFASFVVLAAVATYAVRRDAAAQAAWIFGTGSASMVSLFVTNRFLPRRTR